MNRRTLLKYSFAIPSVLYSGVVNSSHHSRYVENIYDKPKTPKFIMLRPLSEEKIKMIGEILDLM